MDIVKITRLLDLVVHSEVADKHASIGPGDAIHGHASIFQTLIHDLEDLPLLRVHVGGLEVVDAEEAIVELPDVFLQEIPAVCIHDAGRVGVRLVEAIDVEARGRDTSLAGLLVG